MYRARTNWNLNCRSPADRVCGFKSFLVLSALVALWVGSGRANVWNYSSTADESNGTLIKGYIDAGSRLGTVTNRISRFAGACYSVLIDADGDVSRPADSVNKLPNHTISGMRYYAATLGGAFAGFVRASLAATNTSQYPPAPT